MGEMRRVLNAFLQFIEQDTSDNMIIAATNSPKLLDRALFRRFDDVLYYKLPETEERKRLMQNRARDVSAPEIPLEGSARGKRRPQSLRNRPSLSGCR